MPKTIRIRLAGIHTAEHPINLPLYGEGETPVGGDAAIWFSSSRPMVLAAISDAGVIYPLYVGTYLRQVYNFGPEVIELALWAQDDTVLTPYAYKVTFNGVRYRDVAYGPPKKTILPLDDNSFQARVMRAVNAQLQALGITKPQAQPQDFEPDDEHTLYDDTDDHEFGPGYAVDQVTEDEIERAAAASMAARLQRSKSPKPPRVPVPDDDDESEPDPQPAPPASRQSQRNRQRDDGNVT